MCRKRQELSILVHTVLQILSAYPLQAKRLCQYPLHSEQKFVLCLRNRVQQSMRIEESRLWFVRYDQFCWGNLKHIARSGYIFQGLSFQLFVKRDLSSLNLHLLLDWFCHELCWVIFHLASFFSVVTIFCLVSVAWSLKVHLCPTLFQLIWVSECPRWGFHFHSELLWHLYQPNQGLHLSIFSMINLQLLLYFLYRYYLPVLLHGAGLFLSSSRTLTRYIPNLNRLLWSGYHNQSPSLQWFQVYLTSLTEFETNRWGPFCFYSSHFKPKMHTFL